MATSKEHIRGVNALLFSPRELLAVALPLLLAVLFLFPAFCRRKTVIRFERDFRLPYANRDNYHLHSRWMKEASRRCRFLFLGDSAIWGMYAGNDGTLPAQLNHRLKQEACGNIAIDGLHYVAMQTLVRRHGSAIRGNTVFLYLNPLWFNSEKYDLSGTEEFSINHPRLLPQFAGIRSYHADFDKRAGIFLEQHFLFFQLQYHWQNACWGNKSAKECLAMGNFPAANACAALSPREEDHKGTTQNWSTRDIPVQHWSWVKPGEASRQWQALKQTVRQLEKQDNRVIVLLGNINPALLDASSREGLQQLRAEAQRLLNAAGIENLPLPPLPADDYADASHPMESGYARIADFLLAQLDRLSPTTDSSK